MGAAALVIQHMLNRSSRQDEVAAKKTTDLIKSMGEQIDRLTRQQDEDRDRLARLEKAHRETTVALWDEENDNRKLRRGLGRTLSDLDDVWAHVDDPDNVPQPARPNLVRVRLLVDSPRPRRPPDDDRDAT